MLALSEATGEEPNVIIRNVDDLMNKRNNVLPHYTSLKCMEEEVAECVRLFCGSAEIRRYHFWPVWVLENYSAIKEAYRCDHLQLCSQTKLAIHRLAPWVLVSIQNTR